MEMSYREGSVSGGLKDVDYIDRDTCSSPRAKIFLVMTVSFVVAAVVVLVVILTRIETTPYSTAPEPDSPSCPDIAIIGGGLAGTFAAWKLRSQNLTITIYENSRRLGGRIYSKSFPNSSNITFELGATYFIPQLHERLLNLTLELGLNLVPAFNVDELTYYVRGKSVAYEDIGNESYLPYNLYDEKETDRTPMQLLREALQASVADATSSYSQQLDTRSTLLHQLSMEAYHLIMDTAGPGDIHPRGGPAQLLNFVNALEEKDVGIEDFVTIQDGMEKLIDALVDELMEDNDAKISVRRDHRLYQIENNLGIYRLYFKDSHGLDQQVYCANQVVLAVPPQAIRPLQWIDHSTELKQNLDTVIQIPASKLFLQYNSTWWPLNATSVQTDTTLGQVQYLGADPDTNFTVLQAMYTAGEYYDYWDNMVDQFSYHGDLERLTNQTQDNIDGDIFHQWEAAWHVWKAGVDWLKISEDMIQPVSGEKVYVIGSGFAPGYLSKWMEGALLTTEQALDIIMQHI